MIHGLLRRSVLGLVAGLTITALSSDVVAAAPATYTFWCRGGNPVDVEIHPNSKELVATYTFGKHSSGGGALPVGKCAWGDRAISGAEPLALRVLPKTDDERFIANQLTECLRDPDCVVRMNASANVSMIIGDLQKPFSFRRAP